MNFFRKITASKSKSSGKEKTSVKDILVILITAVILAVVIKTFIVDSRIVPSSSMYPTIEIGDRILISKMSYLGDNTPERGDIVVFTPPEELRQSSDYIKRIIGLPGEDLYIADGVVYIDGVSIDEEYIAEKPNYEYGPVAIPEGCYFVMGDNRNASSDSHAWSYPFITEDDIKGKAFVCYWPFSRIGGLE